MPKPCVGKSENNADLIKESRAYCEGISRRAQGTAVAFPITDNPHATLSDAGGAWSRGWTVADDAAGGVIAATAAPCCAIPNNTILA